ncbi:winged helix DNA-binding domain-containing protein [Pseudonocardia sp. C8]|uniref:DNA glycosylase AlkZ-like family protein n=1 Tax=Pseudonocardia sp. C8 TaxID=2762759 RepID=UPI00164240FC|nr:crosslink repair DNA glycosylase YcaQ family protein [Pseudonocardia sp. C8]MBC3191205.1 winged helix DNA-binding domain-containing protein [Pseudonocardia sp. C8]
MPRTRPAGTPGATGGPEAGVGPGRDIDVSAVLAWRSRRQHLDRPHGLAAADVVRRLAGVQAQVPSAAEQAVAVRRAEAVGGTAEALASGALVRVWGQRGTLHLLHPADAPSYLALLASVRSWERPPWQREFATAGQVAALAEVAAEVLPGARLTRAELAGAYADRTGDGSLAERLGSGWGAVLKPLAWQGLLCHAAAGPADGTTVRFTAPPWAGRLPAVEDAAAVAIPAYLGAHGPATPETFGAWLLRGAVGKRVLRGWFDAVAARGLITPVRVGGGTRWARTADVDGLAAARPHEELRLLPAFDQFLLGPGTADPDVLDPAHRSRVSRAAGWIAPVVLHRGRVAGTWETGGDGPGDGGADLLVAPFPGTTLPRDALAAEAAVLGRVLGRTLRPVVRQG